MSTSLTPLQAEAAFWMALVFALMLGIGIETNWGRQMQWPVPEVVETPPAFAKPVLAEPFRLGPPDEFTNITQRPLFIVTRRPTPAAPPPEPPKPRMQKGQFVLTGTILVAEGKFAFLLEKAGNRSRVVAEGKEINGILVKEVAKERVVLSQFDDTEDLILKSNTPPPRPPATAGVVPGAPGGAGPAPAAPGGAATPGAPAAIPGAPAAKPPPARTPALPSAWPPRQ
jgi:type II secretory pathway component PulC